MLTLLLKLSRLLQIRLSTYVPPHFTVGLTLKLLTSVGQRDIQLYSGLPRSLQPDIYLYMPGCLFS